MYSATPLVFFPSIFFLGERAGLRNPPRVNEDATWRRRIIFYCCVLLSISLLGVAAGLGSGQRGLRVPQEVLAPPSALHASELTQESIIALDATESMQESVIGFGFEFRVKPDLMPRSRMEAVRNCVCLWMRCRKFFFFICASIDASQGNSLLM